MQLSGNKSDIKDTKSVAGNAFRLTMKVSRVSIMVNLLLSVVKLLAGILAHSGAMISDAVHSASDVLSTFVVIIGVKLSEKKSDESHPYGHERLECVSSIILAGLLCATGVGIGMSGLKQILAGSEGMELIIPGKMALGAAVLSLAIKEWMFWYTRAAARKINSGALMADAWHHRSDALSSIGAFVGIWGARMGHPVLDSVASVVICGFVLKAAFDIFMDAVDKMVDHSCSEETEQEIRELTEKVQGVERIDVLRTRLFGAKIYVDLEIAADENLSLKEAHTIAQNVHDNIEQSFHEVKHCMIHVNPTHKL